jgi:hypothetical protein
VRLRLVPAMSRMDLGVGKWVDSRGRRSQPGAAFKPGLYFRKP